MLIKNIGHLIKDQVPLKYRFFEGNTIYGKIISLSEGKGAIKLYDGTIIPAIFISENNIAKDKYTKFIIKSFDENSLILTALAGKEEQKDKSLENIFKNLNIPYKKGKEIITSLIKFNLPTSNENILSIYRNMTSIDNLKNMSDDEIINNIQKYIDKQLNYESKEFLISKQIISILQNVDTDFLSFFIENEIPHTLDNILKGQNFISEKFFLNSIIEVLKHTLDDKIEKSRIISLDHIVNNIKSNPEILPKVPFEIMKNMIDNIDILKSLYNNYNLYAFNLYGNNRTLKNNIIIKNRYKSTKLIDADDIKMYISIETENLGIVEGYVYKKNKDLLVSLKSDEKHVSLFKKKISMLSNSLQAKGFNVIDLSIEKLVSPGNIVNLSNFFSDSIFKELDVRV